MNALPSYAIASTSSPPPAVLAYVEVAAQIFPAVSTPARCVNASWIFRQVMRRLGFAGAKALSVNVVAMNAAYYARERARTSEDAAYWGDHGAWAVVIDGIAPNPTYTGWVGHVVGIVQGWLVDSSTSQMSRPAKGIFLPEVLIADAEPRFVRGKKPAMVINNDGCVLRYMARPDDHGFESLPGFQAHSGNVAVAAEIEDRIRSRLGQRSSWPAQ